MAFQYTNGGYNMQPALSYENPYMQQQQQQQDEQQGNMMQMLKQANEIWGGGGETAGGDLMGGGFGGAQSMGGGVGSIQSGGALGSQGGGMMVGNAGGGMGGGAGAAGGGGWQGAMAAAGPWAALAAAVIGTEISGKDEGRRGDDTGDWINHAFGKGLSRDTQYMNEKMWGDDLRNDKLGIGADQNMVTDLMSGDFSNAWDWAKQGSFMKPLKWIEDIWD